MGTMNIYCFWFDFFIVWSCGSIGNESSQILGTISVLNTVNQRVVCLSVCSLIVIVHWLSLKWKISWRQMMGSSISRVFWCPFSVGWGTEEERCNCCSLNLPPGSSFSECVCSSIGFSLFFGLPGMQFSWLSSHLSFFVCLFLAALGPHCCTGFSLVAESWSHL